MNDMKEYPILFSTEMVKAILEGRKTQTRRVINRKYQHATKWKKAGWQSRDNWNVPEPPKYFIPWREIVAEQGDYPANLIAITSSVICPYGRPGALLWVRETFAPNYFDNGEPAYKADWTPDTSEYINHPKWRPSIHMPRRYSRITLEIISVSVERLQDISHADVFAEGGPFGYSARSDVDFQTLWDSINAKRGHPWTSNPWVWVIEFKKN